jgi:hypothetical protein
VSSDVVTRHLYQKLCDYLSSTVRKMGCSHHVTNVLSYAVTSPYICMTLRLIRHKEILLLQLPISHKAVMRIDRFMLSTRFLPLRSEIVPSPQQDIELVLS